MKDVILKAMLLFSPFVLVGWLLWRDADPDGVRTLSYTVGDSSPYVNSLLPGERVREVEEGDRGAYQTVVDEPVYFSVEAPGEEYTDVRVELHFDPQDQPIVELGGLADLRAYAFDFRPMSNAILEELDWTKETLSSDGVMTTLFARDEIKATIDDFLSHPPERSSIATYRATFPTSYRMADYEPLGHKQHLDVSLRGSHEIITYIDGEHVRFSIHYSDVNRTYGADEAIIRVWNEDGVLMLEDVHQDDGNVSEDQTSTNDGAYFFSNHWDEGVYRIELSGTSDIIWREIDTTLRYVTFKNRLYIGDDVGYLAEPRATSFVTNSSRLTVETFHAESPDEIMLEGEAYAIPETHVRQVIETPDVSLVDGSVSVGDIKMTGDGKFALSSDMFFDPDPVSLTPFIDLDDVAYIYATTAVPSTEDGWRTADATFSLASLEKENGAYKFALSLPGLDELGTTIDVHAIELTFTKPAVSWGEALYNEARAFWRALRDVL